MSGIHPSESSLSAALRSYLGFLTDAAVAVDALYEMGDLVAAEDLDAIVSDLEALLEDPGDFEEGLTAAAAIGDDRMMKMAGRRVNPESFTHGSSAQRVEWLRRGLQSGDPDSCDTFRAAGLSR